MTHNQFELVMVVFLIVLKRINPMWMSNTISTKIHSSSDHAHVIIALISSALLLLLLLLMCIVVIFIVLGILCKFIVRTRERAVDILLKGCFDAAVIGVDLPDGANVGSDGYHTALHEAQKGKK